MRALVSRRHGSPLEEPFGRTLVAEIDVGVVAAGTILHGPRHPRRTWLSIDVAPPFRRRGIATALLDELRIVSDHPFRTRGWFRVEGGVAFLDHHGFALLNRCWEGKFDPDIVSGVPTGTHLDEPPTLDEAAHFFERLYQQTHWFDPPEPLPLDRARAFFCGDQLVGESLVGARDDEGRLVGAAGLIRPIGYDPGNELYLVWIGTIGAESDVAAALVSACADFARHARKRLRFEVDESNTSVWIALGRLGVLGEPEFGIFAEALG